MLIQERLKFLSGQGRDEGPGVVETGHLERHAADDRVDKVGDQRFVRGVVDLGGVRELFLVGRGELNGTAVGQQQVFGRQIVRLVLVDDFKGATGQALVAIGVDAQSRH